MPRSYVKQNPIVFVTAKQRSRLSQQRNRARQIRSAMADARRYGPVVPGYTQTGGYYGRYNRTPSENKFFETSVTSTNVNANGSIFSDSLNLIPEGTTESQRLGRKCTINSIHIKGELEHPELTSLAQADNKVRLILYLDKQCNGAAATVTNILETADVNSFRNLAEVGRFQILYDKTIAINANVTSAYNGTTIVEGTGAVIKHVGINKKVNIPLEFSASTGAITELRSNNIGLLAISTYTRTKLLYTCRVRFTG